jgi:predicted esterase
MPRLLRLLLLLALLPIFAWAQSPENRFELGQKLRLFERTLETAADGPKRTKALADLQPVTFTFFSGQIGEAGRLLDTARLTLSRDTITDADRWAASLKIEPATRLLNVTAKALDINVGHFYPPRVDQPEKVTLKVSLLDDRAMARSEATLPLEKVPGKVALPLTEDQAGDFTLRVEVRSGEQVLSTTDQTVSRVAKLQERLTALGKAREAVAEKERTTDRETLKRLHDQLELLAKGNTLETNLPAARLLTEAEEVARAVQAGKPWYGQKKPGEFWVVLATKGGLRVRLDAPPAVKEGKPIPVVFALHGAGGSENMFFDGYGDGLVRKLAAERGWLLVSPQVSGFGITITEEVLDELSKLYPIDRSKVFAVGHSMGAAATMSAVARKPELFRAVAALGGGGSVKASETMKALPVFVGVGEKDIGLTGARALNKSLQRAEVATVQFKEYKGVEHLTIVQLSLRDVFGFFDRALKP